MYHGMHVELRRQLCGVNRSLFSPLHECWEQNLGLQDCRSGRKHPYLLGHLCVPTSPGCRPTPYLKQAFPHSTTLVQRKRHEPPRAHSFLVGNKELWYGMVRVLEGKKGNIPETV